MEFDGYCPYCDRIGGSVGYSGRLLHPECHAALGRELEIFETFHTLHTQGETPMSLTSVLVRTDSEDVNGYPIEDRDGNVLGHVSTLHGPEQKAKIAELLEMPEDRVSFKGDDEDDNGPVEVWGIVGVHVPPLSQYA